jgi:hypothetical protein
MGDAQMKFTKTAAATTVALGALVAVLAYGSTTIAVAQTPAPAPAPKVATPAPAPKAAAAAPAASNIPRHAGIYSGQKVDALTYAPTCPAFNIGMDAAAIQESSSRAYVAAEAARFDSVRDRWDAYEDCITENARRDIEIVRNNLGDNLSNAATSEAAVFNAMNTAASANIERIGKLPAPRAPKATRGAPAAAAAAAAVAPSTVSAWTTPTGRFIGTLTGTADTPTYTSGCPSALGTLTPESFATEATRDGYTRLLDELRVMPTRINEVRTCRQENGQDDYEAVQKAVNDGFAAVFVPRKNAFEREYAAIRFQLNEHRKPGGLLAPAEMGRAKTTAPKTTKKKK